MFPSINAVEDHFFSGSSFTLLASQEAGVSSMSVQLPLEEGGRVFLLQDRGAHPANQVGAGGWASDLSFL